MSAFKWRHFAGEVILWAVRWYCRYGISYRELEEMLGGSARPGAAAGSPSPGGSTSLMFRSRGAESISTARSTSRARRSTSSWLTGAAPRKRLAASAPRSGARATGSRG